MLLFVAVASLIFSRLLALLTVGDRVKIITDTRQARLSIPRRGVVSDAGELYVFVAEGDTVRKSPVQLGYQDEDFAEVLHGVENGDSVVVVGVGGLRTGTKVKVLEPNMQDELLVTVR